MIRKDIGLEIIFHGGLCSSHLKALQIYIFALVDLVMGLVSHGPSVYDQ